MIPAAGKDADEVLRLAGALEDASEHPIGGAIAAGAREKVGGLPAAEGFGSARGSGLPVSSRAGCRGRAAERLSSAGGGSSDGAAEAVAGETRPAGPR